MNKRALFFVVCCALFFLSFSIQAQVPDFSINDQTFTTTNFNKGYALGVARMGNKYCVLVQDSKDGEDEIGVFAAGGELKKVIHIDKQNASAIIYKDGKFYVMSRNTNSFLRELDGDGKVLKTFSLSDSPAGKYYGLASAGARFYFASYNDSSRYSCVYSVDENCEHLSRVAVLKGKALGVASDGKVLMVHVERPGYNDHQLVYMETNGTIADSIAFTTCMGLDFSAGKLLFLKQRVNGNATVMAGIADLKAHRLYFGPKWQNVEITQEYENTSWNAADLRVYYTRPASNEYQVVKNLSVSPQPVREQQDRFGNSWFTFRSATLKGTFAVKLNFDIYTWSVVYTLPESDAITSAAPAINNVDFLSPTAVYDYNAHVFSACLKEYSPQKDFNSNLLQLRNLVNDKLEINGATGPEAKASIFMKQGVGRCYAHTISFAALARKQHISASAVGGIHIRDNGVTDESKDDAAVHTWNRIYHPAGFWFDVDAQSDDDKDGKHRNSHFGYHSGDYYISFIGDYDQRNGKDIFAERSWIRSYEYVSLDKYNIAKIVERPMQVRVKAITSF